MKLSNCACATDMMIQPTSSAWSNVWYHHRLAPEVEALVCVCMRLRVYMQYPVQTQRIHYVQHSVCVRIHQSQQIRWSCLFSMFSIYPVLAMKPGARGTISWRMNGKTLISQAVYVMWHDTFYVISVSHNCTINSCCSHCVQLRLAFLM